MIKSLGLLHVLLSLTIFVSFGTASASAQWWEGLAEGETPKYSRDDGKKLPPLKYNLDKATSVLKDKLEKSASTLGPMVAWWDRNFGPKCNLPPEVKEIITSGSPWMCIRSCFRDEYLFGDQVSISSKKALYYLLYFLLKIDLPVKGNKKGTYYAGNTPATNSLSGVHAIGKICITKSETFCRVHKMLGREERSPYSGPNEAFFMKSDIPAIYIIGSAIKFALRMKTDLFSLSVFLTLLFRRIEDGEYVTDEPSSPSDRDMERVDNDYANASDIVKWDRKNMKTKNLDGAYIGLTAIPADYRALLEDLCATINPGVKGFARELIGDFDRGLISENTIIVEYLFFMRVFAETDNILPVKSLSAFCWTIFSFYDDRIFNIAQRVHETSQLKVGPERQEKHNFNTMLVAKYIGECMKLLAFFVQERVDVYNETCSVQ
ncbi:hypothetical protein PAEPH01_0205 [Pancytospora epiphaga]|nr:hypothetical protein PAEPH01_0205 [Pancytospora epiphaga]